MSLLTVQVGIPIFVTGGIGGVHRHGESSKFCVLLYECYFEDIKLHALCSDNFELFNLEPMLK